MTSCSDFDRRTQFRTSYTNRISFGSETTLPHEDYYDRTTDTLIQDLMRVVKDHGAPANSVEHVYLDVLSLEIDRTKSHPGADLDFLKNIQIYVCGEGSEEILLGMANEIPEGGYSYLEIKVIPKGRDMLELLKSKEMTCRVVYGVDHPIRNNVVVKVTSIYHVDTKRLGV
jgi:hypothetical protein